MFFRDSDDDIARRKAENDDRSMFFHSDEEDDDEGSLFWNSKNKISYDEMYSGEIGKRIFENTAKRFEKMKNNDTNIKNKNTDLWRANKGEKYYYINLDVISYEDKIEDKIEENKAYDVNNYNSGNYFKTLEIAKEVLNSDENSFSNKVRLNKGETYYFLFEENIISVIENYDSIDNERFKIGNYFTTLEIANQVLNSDIYQNRYKGAKEKYTNNLKWRLDSQYYCLDFSNGNILREINKGTNLDEKRHKLGNFFGNYEEAEEVKETLWIETWKNIRDIVNKNLGYGYKQENLVEAIQVTKENISNIIKMLEINDEKSFNYIVNEADELEEIWYKENPCSNENVIIVKANSYIVKFSEVGNKPRLEFYTEEEFKRKFKNLQNY